MASNKVEDVRRVQISEGRIEVAVDAEDISMGQHESRCDSDAESRATDATIDSGIVLEYRNSSTAPLIKGGNASIGYLLDVFFWISGIGSGQFSSTATATFATILLN